jgi:hypothetical protein
VKGRTATSPPSRLGLATFQLLTARSPRTPGEAAAGEGERKDAEQQDTTAPRLTRQAYFLGSDRQVLGKDRHDCHTEPHEGRNGGVGAGTGCWR